MYKNRKEQSRELEEQSRTIHCKAESRIRQTEAKWYTRQICLLDLLLGLVHHMEPVLILFLDYWCISWINSFWNTTWDQTRQVSCTSIKYQYQVPVPSTSTKYRYQVPIPSTNTQSGTKYQKKVHYHPKYWTKQGFLNPAQETGALSGK